MPPIYTKTGDKGETGLLGGVRVSKASARIEAIGSVDELNASIGVVRSASTSKESVPTFEEKAEQRLRSLDRWLADVQAHLFSIGAELASPNGGHEDVNEADIGALEKKIDEWQGQLPELTQFILPSGSPIGAELHRTRSICRRAERAIVALSHADPDRPVRPELLKFLNRLSDALFVAARFANQTDGFREIVWK